MKKAFDRKLPRGSGDRQKSAKSPIPHPSKAYRAYFSEKVVTW
jgi:hypothetical protein